MQTAMSCIVKLPKNPQAGFLGYEIDYKEVK
jgi:hypothetical protein